MGADLEGEGKRSELSKALARGLPGGVERGIRSGLDPNERDRKGWSLLHLAAMSSREWAVEELLEGGADPGARGPGGVLPEEMADPLSDSGGRIRERLARARERQEVSAAAGPGSGPGAKRGL